MKKVNPISKVQGILNAEYARIKKDWAAQPENKVCWCCLATKNAYTPSMNKPHHARGRVRWFLTQTIWWIPLCFRCHSMIHFEKVAWARSTGWIGPHLSRINPLYEETLREKNFPKLRGALEALRNFHNK